MYYTYLICYIVIFIYLYCIFSDVWVCDDLFFGGKMGRWMIVGLHPEGTSISCVRCHIFASLLSIVVYPLVI